MIQLLNPSSNPHSAIRNSQSGCRVARGDEVLGGLALRDFLHESGDAVNAERLRDDPVGLGRRLLFGADRVAPARDDRERNLLIPVAYEARQLPAAHAGQAHIGEDGVEPARLEEPQRLATVGREHDLAALAFEYVREKLAHVVFVVHDEDGHAARLARRRRLPGHRSRRQDRLGGARELDAEGRAAPDLRLDLDRALVPADDAVADREAETHPGLALRREERVEDARAHILAHPGSGVGDADLDAVADLAGRERERAAFGHRVHRVEDHVDEDFAQFARVAHDDRVRLYLPHELDVDALGLGAILPARARDLGDFEHQAVNVERDEVLIPALAGEVLYALDRLRAVLRRLDDDVEAAPDLAQVARLQHQLGAREDAGQRVVEVVRDAGRKLAERGELLHLRVLLAHPLALGLLGLRG